MTQSFIRKIFFGVADRRQMFRLFDRHAQRPDRWDNDDSALFADEWFEVARAEHDHMLDLLPPLWTRGEMFAMSEFLTGSVTSVFFTLSIDGSTRYFHAYCDLAQARSPVEMREATRFATFVNVPELIAMFRSFADVVMPEDLRDYVKVPMLSTGTRQIRTSKPSAAFKRYQVLLDARIKAIEQREGPPEPGDDILLSVITDGRHAAIDLRLVDPDIENEPDNKLNDLVANAYRIWKETADSAYVRPDGKLFELTGAAQMIFSDLGTINVEKTRGFSAYRWIRDELMRMGVPAAEIAFMQDFKKSEAKQRLFGDVRAGKVRFLIGSSDTMGKAIGVVEPLIVFAEVDGGNGFVIDQGHRRAKQAVVAGLEEIAVLVVPRAEDGGAMRSLATSITHEQLNPVDLWRAIERLVALNWTEESIAIALAQSVRQVRKLRLLANVLPAMLDAMAKGDMPNEQQLRTIAAASLDEQKEVWKANKPSKGDRQVSWWSVANGLTKRRMYARDASFGDELREAYGIAWVEDLFAPADQDSRYTTDVDAFLGAQQEWMTQNLPKKGVITEPNSYGEVKLPPKAERVYPDAALEEITADEAAADAVEGRVAA